MPAYRLRAVVLKKTKLGEADNILALLASDGRQVRAVAKGVRKTRSKIGARLEPFSVVDLLLATGRTLEVVTEVETVASHDALRSDLDRSMSASVVAELLERASQESLAEPRVYELTLATLEAMDLAAGEDLAALTAAFLVKALAMLGYRPVLSTCAECAAAAAGSETFSLKCGGVMCPECGPLDESAMSIASDVPGALSALLSAKLGEVAALGMPSEVARDCLVLMKAFAEYHLHTKLKALRMLLAGR